MTLSLEAGSLAERSPGACHLGSGEGVLYKVTQQAGDEFTSGVMAALSSRWGELYTTRNA